MASGHLFFLTATAIAAGTLDWMFVLRHRSA